VYHSQSLGLVGFKPTSLSNINRQVETETELCCPLTGTAGGISHTGHSIHDGPHLLPCPSRTSKYHLPSNVAPIACSLVFLFLTLTTSSPAHPLPLLLCWLVSAVVRSCPKRTGSAL
jgi:hypothetical protein